MIRIFYQLSLVCAAVGMANAASFSIATFQSDATPPIGAPLCGGGVEPAKVIDDPLTARGITFFPEGQQPIVLCVVDWVGIGNGSHRAWREALAEAAGTTPSRVSVHVLHQHDAPMCDFATEDLLRPHGLDGVYMDADFARKAIVDAASALKASLGSAREVTHLGYGEGIVEKVASNRRILGGDVKVRVTRYTATVNPEVRAEPVGTIDPFCKTVSFWNDETPLAVLTFYATHPQSHYGKGHVSADFVGMARSAREVALPGVPHIHFNGAGGNLGAGKWNDGSPENRPVLAGRLEAGMRKGWESSRRIPAGPEVFDWATLPLVLPDRDGVTVATETARLASEETPQNDRVRAARELAWIRRNNPDSAIELARLRLGPVQVLMMPGELFVEYQLAAQDLAPEDFVCVAAYADYGPGYIGTASAYEEGGYETGVYTARCGPEVEAVLMEGAGRLLK